MIAPDVIPPHIAVPVAVALWAWLAAPIIRRARKTDR